MCQQGNDTRGSESGAVFLRRLRGTISPDVYACVCVCVEDGAYLVRDSKGQQANQPFTLMVYYQDKVYNIQIRQQNQQFLLGTGRTVHEVNRRSPRNLTGRKSVA